MPSLIDLRRRIRAVKSTQQITKAMKMIAASRLKRAQDRVVSARPFAQRMLRVLNSLVSRVEQDAHPLLRIPPPGSGRPLLIVVTADRGLCGSFNSNVLKAAGQFIVTEGRDQQVALGLIGRKGRDFFRRRGFEIRYEQVGIFQRLSFAHAADLANAAIDEFTSGRASSVYLVYNEFKSVMSQRIVVERLLPIPRLEGEAKDAGPTIDYLVRAGARGDLQGAAAAARADPGVSGAPRIERGVLRRADDCDGRRDAQLGRHDREPDALHEQGSAGGHHARNHRSGVGRRGHVTTRRVRFAEPALRIPDRR